MAGEARVIRAERLQARRAERAETHKKDEAAKSEPKASLSNPEARCLRFADAAVRPGYNAPIAVAPNAGVILSIAVTVEPETLATRARQRAREPDSIEEWRARMATPVGQEVYRRRKLIERINANLENHGFGVMPVRTLIKVKATALWHALAHNLIAAHRLRAPLAPA